MPIQPTAAERLDDHQLSKVVGRIDPLLAVFITAHYDRLVRLAYLVCGHSADAADAVQRALEQAWRRRDTLRDETRMRPSLDRAVVNEAIRLGRRP
jgi:DNA-directed RNA polymerase specialized sigma24 family protein